MPCFSFTQNVFTFQLSVTFVCAEIQFKWSERHPPESVCSAECELGQAKQYVEGESCCWHCFNCTQYEVRNHNLI